MSKLEKQDVAYGLDYQPQPGDVFDQAQMPNWDQLIASQTLAECVGEGNTIRPRHLREFVAANMGFVCLVSCLAGYELPHYMGETPGHAIKNIIIDERSEPGRLPSQELQRRVQKDTYRIESGDGACTGFFIQQYLITAGHCLTTTYPGGSIIKYANGQPLGSVARKYVFRSTSQDIAIALMHDREVAKNSLDLPLDNSAPPLGERFASSGYPAGGLLTAGVFIKIQLALDHRMNVEIDSSSVQPSLLCDPGMSGSAIVSDKHIAVLDSELDYSGSFDELADKSGVSVQPIRHTICGTTTLTKKLMNQLIEGLKKSPTLD